MVRNGAVVSLNLMPFPWVKAVIPRKPCWLGMLITATSTYPEKYAWKLAVALEKDSPFPLKLRRISHYENISLSLR